MGGYFGARLQQAGHEVAFFARGKHFAALKEKGLTSPYLKPFVVARINPIRFSKSTEFDFDEVIDKMIASAGKFNVDKVKQEDVAKVGGGPPPED